MEIKRRTNFSRDFEGLTYLNEPKYEPLTSLQRSYGVEARFVVGFIDHIRWIPISEVDPRRRQWGGRKDRDPRDAPNDQQWQILVPVDTMTRIPWPTWPR